MKQKDADGFSLIELLMVIGIMSVLAGMVAIASINSREVARVARAKAEIGEIKTGILRLEVDTNEWPNHQTPWQVNTALGNEVWDLTIEAAGLTQDDSVTPFLNWNGPYVSNVPLDPWGNRYFMDTDYSVQVSNSEPCGDPTNPPCVFVSVIG